jgi:hypothetical protein
VGEGGGGLIYAVRYALADQQLALAEEREQSSANECVAWRDR